MMRKKWQPKKVYHMNCVFFSAKKESERKEKRETERELFEFDLEEKEKEMLPTFNIEHLRQQTEDKWSQVQTQSEREIAMTRKSFILSLASEQRMIYPFMFASLSVSFFLPIQVCFLPVVRERETACSFWPRKKLVTCVQV